MPSCRDGLQSSVARVRRVSCTCIVWLMLKKSRRLVRGLRRGGLVEGEGDGALRVNQGGLIGREQPGAVSFERTADGEAGLDALVGVFRVGNVLGARRVRRAPCGGFAVGPPSSASPSKLTSTSPRQVLVPLFVTTLMTPPVEPPYSAVYPLDFTWISSTNSGRTL